MTTTAPLSTLILAAGKGTRMKSEKAKVLHELFFAPMIHHVLHALEGLQSQKDVVIVGHQRDKVTSSLEQFTVEFALQEEQLGTGHAVLSAEKELAGSGNAIMILCGDTPLIQTETLQAMYDHHQANNSTLTVMTTHLANPTNYGRIISDDKGNVLSIVEEKDATTEEKQITEINAGIYCVDESFLFSALKEVGTNNSQGEVYLTDIVAIGVARDKRVHKYANPFPQDVLGVNSRIELAEAHKELQLRHNRKMMLQGISMYSPESILLEPTITLGKDTSLQPGVTITGKTTIGKNSSIGNGTLIHNATIGDEVSIGAYCCLENCTVESGAEITHHTVFTK